MTEQLEADVRNLAKWLNEEQTSDIDRQALARILAYLQQQNAERGEPVGYFSINDYGRWEENENQYGLPFYAQPASEPLTDEQINLFINGRGDKGDDDYVEPTGDGFGLTDADLVRLVRRVEAAHGITKGNT